MKTVNFSTYGATGRGKLVEDGTARIDPGSDHRRDPVSAVKARIERITGCTCWPWREDHWTEDRDRRVTSRTFEASLTRRSRTERNASDVLGTLWVTIDLAALVRED